MPRYIPPTLLPYHHNWLTYSYASQTKGYCKAHDNGPNLFFLLISFVSDILTGSGFRFICSQECAIAPGLAHCTLALACSHYIWAWSGSFVVMIPVFLFSL